jgi:glycosyltransferase involved in cell wall biosynthesis
MSLSVVIPTYGRDEVLINTIEALLNLDFKADEILIIDQTENHSLRTEDVLERLNKETDILWIRIQFPSITRAMNIGLRKANGERVLFLDDDIVPDPELIRCHRYYGNIYPSSIIAGRVLQPWHKGKADSPNSRFLFNSQVPIEVDSFMGGNFSIPRDTAMGVGGFDTNFVKVAYHFEAEFSYRWRANGGKIRYEPKALIHHLKAERGGTRSYGDHLTTLKPDHAVGRYYYNLCTNSLKRAIIKSIKDLGKSVITKHHLRNPMWIIFTLIAEIKGFIWSVLLYRSGRGLIHSCQPNLLVIASHPIQYNTPIFKALGESVKFNSHVLYLTIPDKKSQSLGFKKEFLWDIPLLEGYEFIKAKSGYGKGLTNGFMGVCVRKPRNEIQRAFNNTKPDVALLTGWHFYGMVQIFFSLVTGNIPVILRMDSNGIKSRSVLNRWIYDRMLSLVRIVLIVGTENRMFCSSRGVKDKQMLLCPHIIDNQFFLERSSRARLERLDICSEWNIPCHSFIFLFAGKLQQKKRPLDLLNAFKQLIQEGLSNVHLLVIGTGELEKECIKYAKEYMLPVTFRGFLNQTEIPKAYGISNCIVLPSGDDETWGLVINEAMISGLPAIVSNKVGCGKDLVKNDLTGFTFECGDIESLKHLLAYMVTNPAKAKAMGENARILIQDKYSIEQVTTSIEEAVTRIHG